MSSTLPSFLQSLKQWRWYRWLLSALVLLYCVYIALAYLYVPGKLKDVVQTDVAQLLGRDISVERIAFNPFALSLTVEKFSLSDRPQQPLLAWQRFFVDFDAWASLFGWQIKLGGLQLDAPQITLEQRKQDFNFSDIVQRLAGEEEPPQPDAEKSVLAIRIDDIRIRDGLFRFDDNSGSKPATSSVDNIDIGVQSLYLATGDDQLNPFHLRAKMPGGGLLDLSGDYRADPLLVNGTVKASDIRLEKFADFVENRVPLKVGGGTLGLGMQVKLEQQAQDLQVTVQNGQLELLELALDDAATQPPLLRVKKISVNGVALDLVQQNVEVAQVLFDGVDSHHWLDENGKLRTDALLTQPAGDNGAAAAQNATQQQSSAAQQNGAPQNNSTVQNNSAQQQNTASPQNAAAPQNSVSQQSSTTPQNSASKPWNIHIGEYHLGNSTLTFTDKSGGMNAQQTLSALDLKLTDINLKDGAQIPLTLNALVNDSGKLAVNGTLTPTPFAMQLHYQLQGLALQPFNPYVQANTHLQLQSGVLNAQGDIVQGAGDNAPFTVTMNASLDNLEGQDTRNQQAVLKWQTLTLDQLQLDLAQKNLSIDNVQIIQPDVNVEIAADKQVNLATLVKQTTPPPAETAPATAESSTASPATADESAPWQFAINKISIQKGNTRFRDDSIKPAFKTTLSAMEFQLSDLASNGSKPAPFSLQAKVDRYAPLNVKGTLAPLPQQPGFAFTTQLKGLNLPALSPYTGTFVGYDLKSGKLALDLQYELKQNQLSGKNKIVAKDLYLGDAVASEQAVDAPVALGLALLRDNSGVIDLDVGVSGNLNEPGFSVSGLILKTLLNVIVKAATSPFSLLGSMVGGREDLGDIEFAAGSTALDDTAQEKLQQLAQALTQRSNINVSIGGNALAADDTAALQLQRVQQQIATERKLTLAQLATDGWLDDEDNRDELEDLADDLDLPDLGDQEKALKKSRPELDETARTLEAARLVLADVMAKQQVGEAELRALAEQRAAAIEQFLVEGAGFDHERIDKAKAATLDGRVCKLALEPR